MQECVRLVDAAGLECRPLWERRLAEATVAALERQLIDPVSKIAIDLLMIRAIYYVARTWNN